MDDEEKKKRAALKFTNKRGPVTEKTRELLRQRMKEWHRQNRRGIEMGNALARKARAAKTLVVIFVFAGLAEAVALMPIM